MKNILVTQAVKEEIQKLKIILRLKTESDVIAHLIQEAL